MTRTHIRVLLGQSRLEETDLDMLAIQLTAALDGPLLLYMADSDLAESAGIKERLTRAWQDFIQRVCGP